MTEIKEATLEETTSLLGAAYSSWKDFEAIKNDQKSRFYDLADKQLADQLAERLYTTESWDESDEEVLDRARRFNPGWEIDEWRRAHHEDHFSYDIILVEDVTLKPFTYVNKSDGQVYKRSARSGSVMLDDEYLNKRDPDLYEEISFELPWGERVIKPLSLLEPKQLVKVQPYLYHGKPTVSLSAPRKAKPEELVD